MTAKSQLLLQSLGQLFNCCTFYDIITVSIYFRWCRDFEGDDLVHSGARDGQAFIPHQQLLQGALSSDFKFFLNAMFPVLLEVP
jgi:hypothetical protein